MSDACQNRIDEDDESPVCGDEGRSCLECREKEAAYWARYFGLGPDMLRQERLNQLEQFRPLNRMHEVSDE